MHHVDQGDEGSQALACRTTDARFTRATHGIHEGNSLSSSECIKFANAGIADASLWNIQDSLDTDFIERICSRFQVCNGIFNFSTVVELGATHHFVRDAVAHKSFFHCAALRIGAIHDGDFTP